MDSLSNEISIAIDAIFSNSSEYREQMSNVHEKWKSLQTDDKNEDEFNSLYDKVRKFLEKNIRREMSKYLEDKSGNNFLESLLEFWEEYQFYISKIRELLIYFDQDYLLSSSMKSIYELGVEIFAKTVFFVEGEEEEDKIETPKKAEEEEKEEEEEEEGETDDEETRKEEKRKIELENSNLYTVSKIILGNIRKEREYESTYGISFILKSVLRMMMEISSELLFNKFEDLLLEATKRFYQTESKRLIHSGMSGSEYLDKYLQRTGEERDRARRYLYFHTTFKKIEKILIFELLETHKKHLIKTLITSSPSSSSTTSSSSSSATSGKKPDQKKKDKKKSKKKKTKSSSHNVYEMLQSWNVRELKKVYLLFSFIKGGLEPYHTLIGEYLLEEGMKIMLDEDRKKKLKRTSNAMVSTTTNKNSKLRMIDDLISLWKKYNVELFSILSKSSSKKMNNNRRRRRGYGMKQQQKQKEEEREQKEQEKESQNLKNVIHDSFSKIMNSNNRIPELLSLYLDQRLRIGVPERYHDLTEENQYHELFDIIIQFIIFIRSKDLFEIFYARHLSKRLLGQKCLSLDLEKLFVSKLKLHFGIHMTRKIEGMISDYKRNKEVISVGFKSYLWDLKRSEENSKMAIPKFEFSTTVLKSCLWPIQSNNNNNESIMKHDNRQMMIFPRFLTHAQEMFKKYYLRERKGRKLIWKHRVMGFAEIWMNGYSRKYSLQCSTPQMLILLCFNDVNNSPSSQQPVLSIDQITGMTGLPRKEVLLHLRSLNMKTSHHRPILLTNRRKQQQQQQQEEEEEGEEGASSTSNCPRRNRRRRIEFKPNKKFRSKSKKIRVVTLRSKVQPCPPCPCCCGKFREERNWQIDAAIVRIMKARVSKVQHSGLIMEVTRLLQNRFVPTPTEIKRRINSLIVREYIARDQEDGRIYNYRA